MPVLNTNQLTLLEVAKRVDPDGKTARVAELLAQTNEILLDCPWLEGNLPTGERITQRTGLPSVFFRILNQGVPLSRSTTVQITEGTAMLEARSHIDVKLANLNSNREGFRLSEDKAFIEAMNQTMAETLIYGNASLQPERFTGLAPRYSQLSAGNGVNIISLGGSGNANTSIWLVGWGEDTVYGIYPKSSKAGLEHRDLGEESVADANGNFYQALRTLYSWDCGLALRDWRYVVRIGNIDRAALVADVTGTTVRIIEAMSRALDRIPNLGSCRPAFYLNRTVYSMLRIHALNRTNNVLAIEQGLSQFGTPASWLSFQGVPLRRVDRLLNTEANLAA